MHFTEMKILVIEERARPKIPDTTPEKVATLLKSCWNQSIEKRPSFAEIEDKLTSLLADRKIHSDF